MRVSEIAKEHKTTVDHVLKTLKGLKLKAKDGKQEVSAAVLSVLKSELKKSNKTESKSDKTPAKKKVVKKKVVKVKKKIIKKKVVKKKVVKKKTKVVKKKTSTQETSKPKKKVSKEPLITLKPLSRKRKKSVNPKDDTAQEAASAKDAEETSNAPAEQTTLQPKETDQSEVQAAEAIVEQQWERDDSLEDLEIKVPITVKEFSVKVGQKANIVLAKLMQMGIFAHINQALDENIIHRLTREFGFNLAKVKTEEEILVEEHKQEEENPNLLKPRAPVITFMGHVDHGKTSLLDKIRKSKIADMEHGGITQHMGAYSVKLPKGKITFLDTPGHEAFTAMRARGAHITDIVVLVVAADEGIMPQTEEAIDHARAAEVPIVVALNKIDRKNADVDRVKKQLQEKDLAPEDWGGKTIVAGVSAVTGEGIDELLEMIVLEAELLELKANAEKRASGIVVEAHLSQGRGAVSTLIVQSGTLKDSDTIVVGPYYGKVKAMFDDHNRAIKEAGPSIPVEILGLPGVPEAGEMFYVVEDERSAREIAFRREEQLKNEKLNAVQKITLEDISSQVQEGAIKELNVILKSDVQGSLEALKDSLEKIPSDKIKVKFIHTGVGDVNNSDVLLALASKAVIIAFHVGIGPKAKKELEKQPVDVRQYRIIYDAVNDMRKALEGMLEAKQKKKFLSRIEVREVFKLSKSGIVAGCYVTKGKVQRKANVDVVRGEEVIHSGTISSLKRFKDDVREVNEGMECGITIDGFDQFESGDIIEAYEIETIAQKLE